MQPIWFHPGYSFKLQIAPNRDTYIIAARYIQGARKIWKQLNSSKNTYHIQKRQKIRIKGFYKSYSVILKLIPHTDPLLIIGG